MTVYKLTRAVLGRQPSIDLTNEQFDKIVNAKCRVVAYLALEDLFDLMLGNYEEFERELLEITLNRATYLGAELRWSDAIDTTQLIARRIGNLLTATHGYCEQVPHLISSIYGKPSSQFDAVGGYFRHEHSTVLGYRACAEMRRFVQHRGSVVHGFTSGGRCVVRSNGDSVSVYTLEPKVNVRRLQEDVKFKPSVIKELEALSSDRNSSDEPVVDLRPLVREYLSALGRVHLKIRDLVAADVGTHDAVIEDAVKSFLKLPGVDRPTALAAMQVNEEGLLEGRRPIYVMTEPIERRKSLARRNANPINFERRVITSEVLL
jgi:hypothetical protein